MVERNSSSHVVFGKVGTNAAKYEMDSLVWLCNSNFDARRITVKSTELKRLSVLQNPEYVPVRTDKFSILHITAFKILVQKGKGCSVCIQEQLTQWRTSTVILHSITPGTNCWWINYAFILYKGTANESKEENFQTSHWRHLR